MSEFLVYLGAAIGFVFCVITCVQVARGASEQNLASWSLWCFVDGVVAVTLVFRGGNYLLPATYSLGALLVAIAVRRSGRFEWKFWENAVSALVVASMFVWYFQGSLWATVVATIATGTATIPQMKDAARNPIRASGWLYLGFTVANAVSAAGGKSWAIEERLYGTVCATATFILVILSFRKPRASCPRLVAAS